MPDQLNWPSFAEQRGQYIKPCNSSENGIQGILWINVEEHALNFLDSRDLLNAFGS